MKGCGRYFTKRRSGGREVQRHPLGLIPQSIPKPLSPSGAGKGAAELGAPRALGTGRDAVPGQGTHVQFRLCLQDSWHASQLYQIPIISEKIKAVLSKILFFDSFFASPPQPPFLFSLPSIPPLIHHSLLSSSSSLYTHGEGSFCYPSLGGCFLF